ncbi:methyltransferase domain-containing protein [Maricaulis sp. CAU 1757]
MSDAILDDDDYIIGANQQEIDRLGLQHAIWREAALAAWRRAGLKPGMTVLDVGAGPGYAAFDLARLVGPEGRVVALDQSELFLKAVETGAELRGLRNIECVHTDLAEHDWPEGAFDAVWSRWCLSFVPHPEQVLAGIDRSLRPGGVFVAQEYVDYRSFRIEPNEPVFDRFLEAVSASWVHFGGDPNVARRFPALFAEMGWVTGAMRPLIHAAQPGDMMWTWPTTWLREAPDRMVELGFLDAADVAEFRDFLARREADENSVLFTPMVLETIASKPAG